jgi:hypothetical protein
MNENTAEVISMSSRERKETGQQMTSEPKIDVRRWRDGRWAVTAIDEKMRRFTLVEGDERSSARVIVVRTEFCAEAVAQPVSYVSGCGRVVMAARLDSNGRLIAESDRIFPNGTTRTDNVRRTGRDGESHRRWQFPDGSHAMSTVTSSANRTVLFDRSGRPVSVRTSELSRSAAGAFVARTLIMDGDGNHVGRTTSHRRMDASGVRFSATFDDADGQTQNEQSVVNLIDGTVRGYSFTRSPSGEVTASDWSHDTNGSVTHEVTSGADGSVTTVEGSCVYGSDGSASSCDTEAVTTSPDGHVTRSTGHYGEGADGSWVGSGETTRDGTVVSRSGSAQSGDGSVSSTTRVDYDSNGGGVIVTNTVDKNTGEVTGSVSGFDKDGNPKDVGPNAGSGGSDQPGSGSQPGGGGNAPAPAWLDDYMNGSGQPAGSGSGEPSGSGDGQPSGNGEDQPTGEDGKQGSGEDGKQSNGSDAHPGEGEGEGSQPSGDGTGSEPGPGRAGETPWHDGVDGGPRFGGLLGSSVQLGMGGGPDSGQDGVGTDSFTGMHSALLERIRGGIQPAASGETGDERRSDGVGDNSLLIHLSGRSGKALSAQTGQPRDEEWGDYNNPRVLTAFATTVLRLGDLASVRRASGAMDKILG